MTEKMGCGQSKHRKKSHHKKHSHDHSRGKRQHVKKSISSNESDYSRKEFFVRKSNSSHSGQRRRKSRIYVALFDYQARSNQDMSFIKGDLMDMLDNDHLSDWRFVMHLETKMKRLVPAAYIAKQSSLESMDWFFGSMLRREAETLLLAEQNPVGTFLIRRSELKQHIFSLSIKCYTEKKGIHIKHYRTNSDSDSNFCIFPEKKFCDIIALVDYYSKHDIRLPHALKYPCPKPIPQLWDLAPELADAWEIPKSEFQLIKKIGTGQFGDVWYGKWSKTIEVAVKMCKPGAMTTDEVLQEAGIMKSYRHPRLVALYAVCTKESPIYIVTEYMVNGNLLNHLCRNRSKIFLNHLIYIALQIAEGMRYLERNLLIHRDLAARNVLIGENNSAKIADFGLTRVLRNDGQVLKNEENELMPIKWCALEVIENNEYSTKSDVWSFGITMMELFTYGEPPYGAWTATYTIHKLSQGYRMPRPANFMPEPLYETVKKCWNVNSAERPTFEWLCDYFEAYSIGNEGQYYAETTTNDRR